MKKDYKTRKEEARQEAINWQLSFGENNYSYYDLMLWGDYVTKKAKKYGLVKEFKENGIL